MVEYSRCSNQFPIQTTFNCFNSYNLMKSYELIHDKGTKIKSLPSLVGHLGFLRKPTSESETSLNNNNFPLSYSTSSHIIDGFTKISITFKLKSNPILIYL